MGERADADADASAAAEGSIAKAHLAREGLSEMRLELLYAVLGLGEQARADLGVCALGGHRHWAAKGSKAGAFRFGVPSWPPGHVSTCTDPLHVSTYRCLAGPPCGFPPRRTALLART